jgi:uncharacterized protein (TIGR02231 family)
MKITPLCTLAIFLAAELSAAAVDVPSKIDSVTVYPGFARVTRSFAADLPAGASTLRFSGIPANADLSFVQIAPGTGPALSLGMGSGESDFKDADKSADLLALEAKVRELAAQRDALTAEKDAANAFAGSRAALVTSINRGLAETGKGELIGLAQNAYDDAAAAQAAALVKNAAIDEKLRLLSLDSAAAELAVEKQLARERATSASYSVEAVSEGGKTSGTISYLVSGCTWTPSYIAKADTAAGTVAITYLANILQNSGEDWNDAALTLETSRPGSGLKPVEPPAVMLQQFTEPYYRSAGAISKSLAMEEEWSDKAPLPPVPMMANAVSVAGTLTGFNAALKERASVPSSEAETTLTILVREEKTDFHTETIPLSAETAYLVAKMKNPFPLPVLAGKVQAIVDGSTSGSGYLEETLPGEDLTLGLGANQKVTVERRTIAEKGKNSGVFGGKRVENRSYVNKVTNHMSVPQKIVVRDRVPISKDEKIAVLLDLPANATPDTETGLFDQEVTLKPGESIELPTKFRVSYPSDWKITGTF